jgi:hypothetical protein
MVLYTVRWHVKDNRPLLNKDFGFPKRPVAFLVIYGMATCTSTGVALPGALIVTIALSLTKLPPTSMAPPNVPPVTVIEIAHCPLVSVVQGAACT